MALIRPRGMIGVLLAVLLSPNAWCDDPLFTSHDALAITLAGPFRSLARDRSEAPEYRPATLTFTVADGPRSVPIRLRPRGKSRRDRNVCKFPPLRLDLPRKELDGTVLENQNKLKLATHCQPAEGHQQHVLREYLAYRVLNLLTDVSFRVRLLDVTYVDEERGGRAFTRVGFFIEHKSRLAKRAGLEPVAPEEIDPAELDPGHTAVMALYQYLISNTDYSFIRGPDVCCHNAVLFARDAATYLPVPYDFDQSGFVDPDYALPNERLRQSSVRDRLYRGFCRPSPHLDDAVSLLQRQRNAIYALIDSTAGLDTRNRKRVSRFVDGFYRVLDDPRLFEREISGACRG